MHFWTRQKLQFSGRLISERSGKIEVAIIIYKEILNNAPDHQPSFFQLKNIYYNRSKNKDGIEVVSNGWLMCTDLQSMLLLSEFYFRVQMKGSKKIWAQLRKIIFQANQPIECYSTR